MTIRVRSLATLAAVGLLLAGCTYKNPSVLASDLEEPTVEDTDPQEPPVAFLLGAGDTIGITVARNLSGQADAGASRREKPAALRIETGDVISMNVWRRDELHMADSRVDQTGSVCHPVFGYVKVLGKTAREIQQDMTQRCRRYATDPRVTISVTTIWRYTDFEMEDTRVDETGRVSHPVFGDVPVAGRTTQELREDMAARCRAHINNPLVTIRVASLQSQKVMVLGQVYSPKVFTLSQPLSVLEAITQCGGFTERARSTHLMLLRHAAEGEPRVIRVNAVKLLARAALKQDLLLRSGDILFVPSSIEADLDEFFQHVSNATNALRGAQTSITLWPNTKDVLTKGRAEGTGVTIAQ